MNNFLSKLNIFKNNPDIKKDASLLQENLFSFLGRSISFDNLVQNGQNNEKLIEYFNTLSEVHAPIQKFYNPAKHIIPDLMIRQSSGKYKYADGHWLKPIIDNYFINNFDKHIIYRLLLGNVFINAMSYGTIGSGMKKRLQELILLPPQYTYIKATSNKDFRLNELLGYEFRNPGYADFIQIPKEEVLHIKNSNPLFNSNSYMYGVSSLVSCEKNLRSICSGYGAKVGLYEHGPRVIITGKTQGEFAAMSVQSNEDVKALQKRINEEYGMQSGQFRVMITDIPLDVHVVGGNIADLQINENNKSDNEKICSVLDIDPLVVYSSTDSTFSNSDLALDDFYNGSFKRLIDSEFQKISLFLNQFDANVKLVPNYSNIPRIVKAQKSYSDELLKKLYAGLLTRNEYFELINERVVNLPEFNEYRTFYNGSWYPLGYVPSNNNQIAKP